MKKRLLLSVITVGIFLVIFIFWFNYKTDLYLIGKPETFYLSSIEGDFSTNIPSYTLCANSICYFGAIKYNRITRKADFRNIYLGRYYIKDLLYEILGKDIKNEIVANISHKEWRLIYDRLSDYMLVYNSYSIFDVDKDIFPEVSLHELPLEIEDHAQRDYIEGFYYYKYRLTLWEEFENDIENIIHKFRKNLGFDIKSVDFANSGKRKIEWDPCAKNAEYEKIKKIALSNPAELSKKELRQRSGYRNRLKMCRDVDVND